MTIQPLPEATSRLLGSSQVLTTPASLVKELLDNAIDAKATAVEVVISANTLDKIEVRDNGHGIAPRDLAGLGKRGHTSKLRKFEELRIIGGLTLGFRGEALASAVELGEVSVTTRTEGETVATAIKLKARIGIEHQSSTSHPVGTTVCVRNVFSKLPVRKQNALKDAKKTLSLVKDLLRSYALARLNLRLSLKVLKADKSNWSFAPRPNDGLREIVSQVISRDLAVQCMEKHSTVPISSGGDEEANKHDDKNLLFHARDENLEHGQHSDFVFHAFLPRPDADLSKISAGHYVSVDSRPVSCVRGTLKKLVAIYKTYICSIAAATISEKIKNPFIRLNIVCPNGSYDPNLEPAKDDLLFEDESRLLSSAEAWFRSIYGDHVTSLIPSQEPEVRQDEQSDLFSHISSSTRDLGRGEMDTSSILVSAPVEQKTIGLEDDEFLDDADNNPNITGDAIPFPRSPRAGMEMRLDMSEDYTEKLDIGENARSRFHSKRPNGKNAEGPSSAHRNLNPWVIAKMNAPVVQNQMQESNQSTFLGLANNQGRLTPRLRPPCSSESLTPHNSPKEPRFICAGRFSPEIATATDQLQAPLEIWLNQSRTADVHRSPTTILEADDESCSPRNTGIKKALVSDSDIIRAREMVAGMLWTPPATQKRLPSKQHRGPDAPFLSPLKAGQPIAMQDSSSPLHVVKTLPSRHPQYEQDISRMISDANDQESLHSNRTRIDLEDALDFERRKETATRKFREEFRQSHLSLENPSKSLISPTRASPHTHRQTVTMAAMDDSQGSHVSKTFEDRVPAKIDLPDGDPRAYLMRRQQSLAASGGITGAKSTLKRTKTSLLPLESIPDGTELHRLVQCLTVDTSLVERALLVFAGQEEYVVSGKQSMGLDFDTAGLPLLERQTKDVIRRWLGGNANEAIDVELDLGRVVGQERQ